MSKNNFRIPDYIDHIIDAITRIEGYIKGFSIEGNISKDCIQHYWRRSMHCAK